MQKCLLERKRSYLTEKGLFSRKARCGEKAPPLSRMRDYANTVVQQALCAGFQSFPSSLRNEEVSFTTSFSRAGFRAVWENPVSRQAPRDIDPPPMSGWLNGLGRSHLTAGSEAGDSLF